MEAASFAPIHDPPFVPNWFALCGRMMSSRVKRDGEILRCEAILEHAVMCHGTGAARGVFIPVVSLGVFNVAPCHFMSRSRV